VAIRKQGLEKRIREYNLIILLDPGKGPAFIDGLHERAGQYEASGEGTRVGRGQGHGVTRVGPVGARDWQGGTSCVIRELHHHCPVVSIQLQKAEPGNLCQSWHRFLHPEESRVFP
jgi:hypothetical protein